MFFDSLKNVLDQKGRKEQYQYTLVVWQKPVIFLRPLLFGKVARRNMPNAGAT